MAMTTRDVHDFASAFAYFKQEWDAGRYRDSDAELFVMMSMDPGKMGRRMAAYQKAHPQGQIGRKRRPA
jgi:hypothetical protein